MPESDSASPPSKPSNATHIESSSSGLSAGPVAGIAIGCFVVGIILASIGAFLIQRRRGRTHRPTTLAQNHLPPKGTSDYEQDIKAPKPISGKSLDFLPQPVEDAVIAAEVSKLRDGIKNHVKTYYTPQNTQSRIDESTLNDLAVALGVSTSYVVKLLVDPATLDDTLRLYIAWTVISKSQTVIPKDLVDTVSGGSGERNMELYSKWKVFTGALLEESLKKNPDEAKKATQTDTTLPAEMDSVLKLFVSRDVDEAKRHRNLKLIIGRAEKLEVLLFSQPGSFEFRFNEGKSSSVVVFPSLVQVVDDDAHVLMPPRTLWEAEFSDVTEVRGNVS